MNAKFWIAFGAVVFILGFAAHLALFKYSEATPATNVTVSPSPYHVGPFGP
jgi:hypothetical protein